MSLTNEDDGTTVISGPVVDQAALHGLLEKLRDVGIPLVSLTPIPPDAPVAPTVAPPATHIRKGTDMATTTHPKVPMDKMRKPALVAGVLYLVTFVGSIPALPLYHDILHNPSYLLGGGSDTGVLWGAIGEVICALAGIGTAVALYPVAKRHSETAALGFVTSRVIEAAMIMVGVLSVLSLVTLHKAGASGADAASMVSTGRSLVALHDWTFLFGPGIMPAINALCIGTVMYRTRLIPRIIPTVGLIGAPMLLAVPSPHCSAPSPRSRDPATLLAFPIAAWEFSFGVWMTFKGFKPSAVAELPARAPPPRPPPSPWRPDPMIEIHEVTKRYGSTVAVDGLSFEVREGEVTGFLGPNGAGKSTTMRMMVGLIRPTSLAIGGLLLTRRHA